MLVIVMALLCMAFTQPGSDTWEILARVKFTEKFFPKLNEYYLVPLLDSRIRSYEHKDFRLTGHFLPMELDDANTIILSRHPYAACFFCGGAGPESVAEVVFKTKHQKFKPDQVIAVKGTLILNEGDVNHMNFILRDAVVISK